MIVACNFVEKEIPTQMFSCRFYENFKNSFFMEALGATESPSQAVHLDIIINSSIHQYTSI